MTPAAAHGHVSSFQEAGKAETKLRAFFMQAPAAIAILEGPEHRYTFANPLYQKLYGRAEAALIGRSIREVFPEVADQGVYELFDTVFATGEPFTAAEYPVTFEDGGETKTGYYNFVIQPVASSAGVITDLMVQAYEVTEQVAAKKQLEIHHEQWQELANAMSQMVWIGDEAGNIVYINERRLEYSGLYQNEEGAWQWEQFVHPDDLARTTDLWMASVETGVPYVVEHRLRIADGSFRWHLNRAFAKRNADGRITKWYGSCTDIHDWKEAEAASQKAHEATDRQRRLYQTVNDNTPDLIYIFDLKYRFTYANQALLQMWGKSWDEAIGKGLLENGYEPWHAEMHHREIDQVVATKKPIRGTVSFPHATLGKRIYDYIFSPVLNAAGEVEAIAGTTRDISDASALDAALRESEVRFRLLAEDAPMWVWMADEKSNIQFANGELLRFLGFKHYAEYTGQAWQQIVHPDDVAPVQAAYAQAAANQDQYSMECRHLNHHTGAYEWFLIRGTPRLEAGVFRGFIGTAINIQRQKELTENLEAQVAARTAELLRSNADLQQFAHVASHDLKEPLRKIKTFSGMLQRELGEGASSAAATYMSKINSAAGRMADMVDGVLAYSNLNAGQQTIGEIDLTEIIRSIEVDAEIAIAQQGATITYGDLPRVEGAQVLLYQLFYNLINNSLKFAKANTLPRISIASREATLAGRAAVEIQVADNGIGFAQDDADRIFDTFLRLNAKDAYEGTGLGLGLCKKIVERHGGTIRAESSLGAGAVFTITLPLRQAADNI